MAPLWFTAMIASVAPVAALGGVVLGQRMQRNTTREQLAEQRRVHEQTWSREDRHRFSDEKRVIYAKFLATSEQVTTLSGSWLHKIRAMISARLADDPTPDPQELHRAIMTEADLRATFDEVGSNFRAQLAELELVASNSLRESAVEMWKCADRAVVHLTLNHQNRAFESIIDAANARTPLLREMRRDLGYEVEPSTRAE